MFAKLSRAALTVVVATAAFAGTASADSAPRVEYRYFGQGAYVVVIPADNAPYALTGARRDTDYWNRQNVRVIETGQGRYIVPPTR